MKCIIKVRIRIFTLLFAALIVFSSCKSESDTDRMSDNQNDKMMSASMSQSMNAAMKTMMDNIRNYSITGDPDYDFAMILTPHHQAAIDMSKAYLDSGKTQSLKDFAQKNIDIQQNEINVIQDWMARQNDYQPSSIGPSYKSRVDKAITDMANNMSMQNSDNPDLMFTNAMIPHHQSAVDLAKIEQDFGKINVMRNLSKKIINEQNDDIKNLQSMKTGLMNK
jgi:uncharacterized protein (DUF305 family)